MTILITSNENLNIFNSAITSSASYFLVNGMVSKPYSNGRSNYYLVNFPFCIYRKAFCYRSLLTLLQLFQPACTLLSTSLPQPSLHYTVEPRYLNSLTFGTSICRRTVLPPSLIYTHILSLASTDFYSSSLKYISLPLHLSFTFTTNHNVIHKYHIPWRLLSDFISLTCPSLLQTRKDLEPILDTVQP